MTHDFSVTGSKTRQVLAASVLIAAGLVAGCQKAADAPPTTVGQKVDSAIEKTREVAADVKAEAKTALNDAQTRVNQDGPKVETRAAEMASSAGQAIDDVAITAQVSAGLARDPDLSAVKIDVDTKQGEVVLRGPAPTAAARERAGELARAVKGVKTVTNQLVVKAG